MVLITIATATHNATKIKQDVSVYVEALQSARAREGGQASHMTTDQTWGA